MKSHKYCRNCKWVGDVDPVSKCHNCQNDKVQRLAEVREFDPEFRDNFYCHYWEKKS